MSTESGQAHPFGNEAKCRSRVSEILKLTPLSHLEMHMADADGSLVHARLLHAGADVFLHYRHGETPRGSVSQSVFGQANGFQLAALVLQTTFLLPVQHEQEVKFRSNLNVLPQIL